FLGGIGPRGAAVVRDAPAFLVWDDPVECRTHCARSVQARRSRRTPLNFDSFFFWSMKRPVSRLRLVQCSSPCILVLSCERLRTAPFRASSPTGLLTATGLPPLLCSATDKAAQSSMSHVAPPRETVPAKVG